MVKKGDLHGIKIARNAPQISHLAFADDNLLFTRANPKEADKVLNILATYQRAFGQVVNLEKFESSFSRNVPNIDKDIIYNKMGVKTVDSHIRYLGLPCSPLWWTEFGRS